MDSFTVYVHYFPNGKVYVGITNQRTYARWRSDGSGYKTQPLIWNAIQKHGWENIRHEIVAENVSQEIAEIIEVGLIVKYKSDQRDFGYNVESGGFNNCHYKRNLTDEQREKMRNIFLQNAKMFERLSDEEVIEQLRIKRPNWEYLGGYTRWDKPMNVRCKLCGKERTVRAETVLRARYRLKCDCKLEIKRHPISAKNREALNKAVCKSVEQYTREGILIATYESIRKASQETSVNNTSIGYCCNGKRESAGGFVWKFAQ